MPNQNQTPGQGDHAKKDGQKQQQQGGQKSGQQGGMDKNKQGGGQMGGGGSQRDR